MKRINTSTKGRNHEKEDAKHCIALGYRVCFRSIRTKWQRIDYANLFYIVANVPKTDVPAHNYFISSKSNGHYNVQHTEQLTAWTFERAREEDIVELRDHRDGEWKFSHVDCNHKKGCKDQNKTWSRTPSKKTCGGCARKLKIIKHFISPVVRVSRFTTHGIEAWEEEVV